MCSAVTMFYNKSEGLKRVLTVQFHHWVLNGWEWMEISINPPLPDSAALHEHWNGLPFMTTNSFTVHVQYKSVSHNSEGTINIRKHNNAYTNQMVICVFWNTSATLVWLQCEGLLETPPPTISDSDHFPGKNFNHASKHEPHWNQSFNVQTS